MRALQLATHGMIPTCPIGLNSLGQLACGEIVTPEPEGDGGGGFKGYVPAEKRRKFSERTKKVDWLVDDIVEETAGGTVVVESERGQTEVVLPEKRTVRFAPPINPSNDSDTDRGRSDLDRELIRELRADAIRDHQRRVLQQLEEERMEEEELAVFLLMIEED